jgi:hypothetical protein
VTTRIAAAERVRMAASSTFIRLGVFMIGITREAAEYSGEFFSLLSVTLK